MALERPLVSVITPVRNGRVYIGDCIESILSQSYPRIEHVIVDANSDDGTLEIIREYHNKYPARIKFISEADNGPGEGWNKGLKMARGDIFGCIGYDDRYVPDAIETVVNFFGENPDAQFLHGNCDVINVDGNIIFHHKVEEFSYKDFVSTARHISTPSAFYTRAVMEKIGWCDSSGDDFDVMLRITANFRVFAIDQVLSQLRLHNSFFRPVDFKKRGEMIRDFFVVSRRYGGGLFSRIALSYYFYTVFTTLHMESIGKQLRDLINRLRNSPTTKV